MQLQDSAVEAVHALVRFTRNFGTRKPIFHAVDAIYSLARDSGSVHSGLNTLPFAKSLGEYEVDYPSLTPSLREFSFITS